MTSMISLTPFCLHNSISLFLIALEAFVKSGYLAPSPAQKSFIPPPVPVDSTIGVFQPFLPCFSATTVVNGYTVDEPTIVMFCLAKTVPEMTRNSNPHSIFCNIILLFQGCYTRFRIIDSQIQRMQIRGLKIR